MLSDLWYRLRALFRRGAMERELDDELRFHLEQSVDAHMRAGQTREEATRLARIELGGLETVKEEVRDTRGVRLIEDVVADVRYGARVLRKARAFTTVAVLTLALGIGANSAMFSLVNTVLLRPLPYPDSEQLVRLHANKPGFDQGSISLPNFVDWQSSNRTFAAMAVSRAGAFTLTGSETAERISAELVTSDYFTVLGVEPIVGRSLARGEDAPNAPAIVLLGEALWKRKYEAAPEIVGKSILLDGKSYAVVGVMPASTDLRAISGGSAPDVYVPIGQINGSAFKQRAAGLGIHGIGRLRPDVSVSQARADLTAVAQGLATTYPDTNKSVGATIVPLHDAVVGNVRPYVFLLFGAVGLVLLIACVNVANLLLARAAGRSRELGIRLAVGASFGRLVRQLLTESLLLATAGGAVGLLLAWWCSAWLFDLLPRGVPHSEAIGLDGRALLFTAAISIVAGVLAGLAPALKASRPDLHATLKEGGRGPSTTRYRTQAVFVILQMAMALVLLVGAGLLVRTLVHLSRVDPGFRANGVVTLGLSMSPSLTDADPARVRLELQRIEHAIAAGPGVVATSLAWGAVPIENNDQLQFWKDGQPPASSDQLAMGMKSVVGPDYLTTMQIPLVHGRFFAATDNENAPRVAVVDDVFARTHFPGEDAVGKRIHVDDYDFEPVEIVGVVGHVKQWGLDQDETTTVRSQIYEPVAQLPDSLVSKLPNGVVVLVRAQGDLAGVAASLRTIVQALGAENVVFHVRTVDDIISGFQATRRFVMYVLVAFAVLALVLSGVGIYGVVSYVVAQRTTEIGIRMALGARGRDIMTMILRQGAKLTLAGVGLGVIASIALTPLMGRFIYGVDAIDPVTFVAVACGVCVVALAAMVLPARRAMRMDPMQALRTD